MALVPKIGNHYYRVQGRDEGKGGWMGSHLKLNRDIVLREPRYYTFDSLPCNSSLLEIVNVKLVRVLLLAPNSEICVTD